MPAHTLVIHAHPRPGHSAITRELKSVFDGAQALTQHSLYERYPDFDIDVPAEQAALVRAQLIVWLAPVHWYSVPALLKHWIDQVLVHGWTYGEGGAALRGKTCWWVCSAGAPSSAYAAGGMHQRPFAEFVAPIEQTARFCGMEWLSPFVVHGGHATPPAQREAQVQALGEAFARHRTALAPATSPSSTS